MLTVATLLWEPNDASQGFSRAYDEGWVDRLYRGFARNLSRAFVFVCFTDRTRVFAENVEQLRIIDPSPSYATCIEPYRLGVPMILAGLDTIVTGNIDHLADYCETADRIALPRDPYAPHQACNGVALVPAGHEHIAALHSGENDMEWVRRWPHVFIDDLWPGHVVSYKGAVRDKGLGDARIVYFHGDEKPHQLGHVPWVAQHWS